MKNVVFVVSAEKLSDQWSQAVGETQSEQNRYVESTVDKRGCRQVEGGELSDHDIVGQTDDYDTDLPDDNRYAQTDKFPIVFLVGREIIHVWKESFDSCQK